MDFIAVQGAIMGKWDQAWLILGIGIRQFCP